MSAAVEPEQNATSKPTGVVSLPQDKPKIAFHAAMMAIQNFGFFKMYFDVWGSTLPSAVCDSTRYAVGMMAAL